MEITADFLESALQSLKEEIFSSLHVAMPGNIQSYDAEKRTAVVQPALRRKNTSGETVTAPLLRDVPVFLAPSAGVVPGAPCLLIFADFCIDGWYDSARPSIPPSPRAHDLSDAFALVGFYPRSTA